MKTLYRFHAEWCMPCKASAPAWEAFKQHNPSLQFQDVDVDMNEEVVTQFGIMSVPTLVLVEDDKIIKTRIGSFSEGDLATLVIQGYYAGVM